MKKTAILLSVALLSLMIFVTGPTQSQKLKDKIHRKADKIANNYIVVLDLTTIRTAVITSVPFQERIKDVWSARLQAPILICIYRSGMARRG